MKSILLCCFMIFLTNSVNFSQTYHPLPESNVFWHSNYYNLPMYCECLFGLCTREQYRVTDDTLINDLVYHKIDHSGYYMNDNCNEEYFNDGYQGAFRNDIENKKVWFIPEGQMNENILYEFGLEIGDTLTPGFLNPNNYWDFWVEDIDSVGTENGYRKVFFIRSWLNMSEMPFTIIEGIGGQSLIAPFESWFYFEEGYSFNCINVNDNVIYGDDCDQIVGTESEMFSVGFEIFPNPSSGLFWIRNGLSHQNINRIEVYNFSGIRIEQMTLNTTLTLLDLQDQAAGIYNILLKSNSGIYCQRIIIQ